nr:hypothetical protein [Tanacetum cinerariifolium]
MNPYSKFFVDDNNKKYLPMGLLFHPKGDELLVLGRRSDLFMLSFAIKDTCFNWLSDPDVYIRNATRLPYNSNYQDLATTGELGFDEIETTTETLSRAMMNLLDNMKKSKETKNACDFSVKLKWLFTEVDELEKVILGALRTSPMRAEQIRKKIKFRRELSELEWVLKQLVKRQKISSEQQSL